MRSDSSIPGKGDLMGAQWGVRPADERILDELVPDEQLRVGQANVFVSSSAHDVNKGLPIMTRCIRCQQDASGGEKQGWDS